MEQRLSLVTLGASDLRGARTFYESMGWRPAPGTDDVVFLQAGGMVLALWDRARLAEDSEVTDGGGWGGVTLAYNARSPAEVDAVVAEARAAGDGRQGTRDDVLGRIGFTPDSEDAASDVTANGLSSAEAESFVRLAGQRTSASGPPEVVVSDYRCVLTQSEQDPLPRAFYQCMNGPRTLTFVRS